MCKTIFVNNCDTSLDYAISETYLFQKYMNKKLGHTNTGVLSGVTMHKITTPSNRMLI